jgi:hypothetical protein
MQRSAAQLALTQVQALDRLVGVALVPQAAGNALLEDGHLGVEGIVHCRQGRGGRRQGQGDDRRRVSEGRE